MQKFCSPHPLPFLRVMYKMGSYLVWVGPPTFLPTLRRLKRRKWAKNNLFLANLHARLRLPRWTAPMASKTHPRTKHASTQIIKETDSHRCIVVPNPPRGDTRAQTRAANAGMDPPLPQKAPRIHRWAFPTRGPHAYPHRNPTQNPPIAKEMPRIKHMIHANNSM
jgi:hypothetical protein